MKRFVILSLCFVLIQGFLLPRDLAKPRQERNLEKIKHFWLLNILYVDVPKAIIKEEQKADKGFERISIPLHPRALYPAKAFLKKKGKRLKTTEEV